MFPLNEFSFLPTPYRLLLSLSEGAGDEEFLSYNNNGFKVIIKDPVFQTAASVKLLELPIYSQKEYHVLFITANDDIQPDDDTISVLQSSISKNICWCGLDSEA